jgi:hypothetical protein
VRFNRLGAALTGPVAPEQDPRRSTPLDEIRFPESRMKNKKARQPRAERKPKGLEIAPSRAHSMPRMAQVFVGLVIAAGVLSLAAAGNPTRDVRFWYWAAACVVGEMLWLRLPLGRATMSMGSTANFAALLVLPTPLAIPAATLGAFAAERAVMRKPLVRSLFNAAGTALTVGATGLVLQAFAPAGVLALRSDLLLLAAIVAAFTYYAFNRSLVTAVLALDGALPMSLVWRRNFDLKRDVLPCGAALSLGVVLAELHQHLGPIALAFVILPALIVFQTLRRLYSASTVKLTGQPSGLIEPKRAVNE